MAITRAFPGIQVEVLVEGEPLKEYDDEDEEVTTDKVTKFIEAKSGSEFKIRWTFTPPFPGDSVCFYIYMDGTYVCGAYAQQPDFLGPTYINSVSGIDSSKGQNWFHEKFCFSEITIGNYY
jgi:hypothetical protein